MRRFAFTLLVLTILCPPVAWAQATLNKCIDAQGKITYSNQACRNAREVHTVQIDPAPIPDKPSVTITPTLPAVPVTTKLSPASAPVTIQPKTRQIEKNANATAKSAHTASARRCDSLTDKLGRVLDKMDQAHRKGYTLEQMNKWNEEVRDLERKKQQSSCF
ncbi:MAG: DUF4124 domain-containing protein [Thiobacillus sp.]